MFRNNAYYLYVAALVAGYPSRSSQLIHLGRGVILNETTRLWNDSLTFRRNFIRRGYYDFDVSWAKLDLTTNTYNYGDHGFLSDFSPALFCRIYHRDHHVTRISTFLCAHFRYSAAVATLHSIGTVKWNNFNLDLFFGNVSFRLFFSLPLQVLRASTKPYAIH